MLPVEGTDVCVSRFGEGKRVQKYKQANPLYFKMGSKVPFPAHSTQWLGSKMGGPDAVSLFLI